MASYGLQNLRKLRITNAGAPGCEPTGEAMCRETSPATTGRRSRRATAGIVAALSAAASLAPAAAAAEIRGAAFSDLNRDGAWDKSEPPVAGRVVFLDANRNGRRDAGEQFVESGEDGAYAFPGLPAGSYTVAAEPLFAALSTAPAGAALTPATVLAAQDGPRLPTVADLNGDDWPDVIVSNVFSNSITALYGDGNGGLAAPAHLPVGAAPRFVLAHDLNGDGALDLAVTNMNSGNVSVLLNQGGGSFSPAASYPAAPGAWIVQPGDFDGDSVVDLVVMNQNSHNVTLLRNAGNGTFTLAGNFATGTWPHDMVVRDLTGDGRPDLVLANWFSADLSILVNTGGSFAAAVQLPVDDGPLHARFADLDGDGQDDIVTDCYFAGTLNILWGQGGSSFSAPDSLPTVAGTHDVAAVDVDLDGRLDLVAVGYVGNAVEVFRNEGGRAFSSAGAYSVGQGPLFVQPADLDGDGAPDLVVNNSGSDSLSFLLNRADGLLVNPQLPIGDNPRFFTLADLTRDGLVEIIAANFDADTVAILGNHRGSHHVTLADGQVAAGLNFGSYALSGQVEPPDGDNSFKVRLGAGAYRALSIPVGRSPQSQPVKIRRTRGTDSRRVRVDAVFVEGDPSRWTIELEQPSVLLGPAPTFSAGDVNFPGVIGHRLGDGAVDEQDLAIFEGCYTGPDVVLDPLRFEECLQLDFDGDLDIDEDDLARLLDDWTGPITVPWNHEIELRVAANADASLGETARVQILATEETTGRTRSAFVTLRRQDSAPGIAPFRRTDFTIEASSKLVYGRTVSFDLGLFSAGTEADNIEVVVQPIAGFGFVVRNGLTGQPQSVFATDAAPGGPQFPGSIKPVRLDVTTPVGWPRLSAADVVVTARSLVSGLEQSYTLEVIKAGPLWTPSDLLPSVGRARSQPPAESPAGERQDGCDGRRHRVLAGRTASFGFRVMNPLPSARTFALSAVAADRVGDLNGDGLVDGQDLEAFARCLTGPQGGEPPAGCDPEVFARADLDGDGDVDLHDYAQFAASAADPATIELTQTTLALAPNEQAEVFARVTARGDLPPGRTADWLVALTDTSNNNVLAVNRIGIQVTNIPKIILVSLDGLNPEYMYMNAAGTGPGQPGDWLMPRVQELIARGTAYPDALGEIPSVTDQNQTAALTGTHMGPSGIGSLIQYYNGRLPTGAEVLTEPYPELLRYGAEGKPVFSLFDVAKLADPGAYSIHATGKWWVDDYVIGGCCAGSCAGGGNVAVDSLRWPYYIDRPQPHLIGDVPLPSWIPNWGGGAGLFPSNAWVMDGSLRMLRFEDPDQMFILLAETDDAGHMMGGAWDPAEWNDGGTPEFSDDVSRVNPRAFREGLINVVRETDHQVGLLIDELEGRGILDDTYIVLLSDHGMITLTPHRARIGQLLEQAGFINKDDYSANAGGPIGLFFDVADAREAEFEAALETAPPIVPGFPSNPWIVINRQEMQTGVDARTGVRFGGPDEMYSEFFAEHHSGGVDMARWPDFLVLFTETAHILPLHFDPNLGEEEILEGEAFQGGHGLFRTQPVVLVVHGPGVPAGQVVTGAVGLADIAPSLYELLGWPTPFHVQGFPLPGLEYPQP